MSCGDSEVTDPNDAVWPGRGEECCIPSGVKNKSPSQQGDTYQ